MDELTGIAFGNLRRASNRAASYANEVDRANGEIEKANQIIANKNKTIAELQARIAELELALAVEQAVAEAGEKVLAEWKALQPQSPLRQVVGKLKDGKPLTKSMSIWNTAFDAAARKRGITNPLAHRIS